jgi:pyruvate-formate lyase-activating enzyme
MRKELEDVRELLEFISKLDPKDKMTISGLLMSMPPQHAATYHAQWRAKQALATLDSILKRDEAEMVERVEIAIKENDDGN